MTDDDMKGRRLTSDDVASIRPGTCKPGIDDFRRYVVGLEDVAAAIELLKDLIYRDLVNTNEELPDAVFNKNLVSALEDKINKSINKAFAAVTDQEDGGGRS